MNDFESYFMLITFLNVQIYLVKRESNNQIINFAYWSMILYHIPSDIDCDVATTQKNE